MSPHAALHPQQPITNGGEAGDRRNTHGHLRTAELRGEKYTIVVDVHTVALRVYLDIQLSQLFGLESPPLLLRQAILEKREGQRPIEGPRIEVPKAQPFGHRLRSAGLT